MKRFNVAMLIGTILVVAGLGGVFSLVMDAKGTSPSKAEQEAAQAAAQARPLQVSVQSKEIMPGVHLIITISETGDISTCILDNRKTTTFKE